MRRALGSGEHFAWLKDQEVPLHFALTAQIKGQVKLKPLRLGIDKMQQRHPLLRVCIEVDESGQPYFVEQAGQIPLRIVPRHSEQDWQQEVERELAEAIATDEAPLVRFVLVHSAEISELIVTCHHSIGDGMSMAGLLKALLQVVAVPETNLEPLAAYPFLESLIAKPFLPESTLSPQPSPDIVLPIVDSSEPKPHLPRILSWSMSVIDSQQLVKRCRQERTTVHAAICAAFLTAIAHQQHLELPATLSCLSPMNVRRCLDPVLGDDVGFYFHIVKMIHTLEASEDFWTGARSLKAQLNQGTLPETLFSGIPLRQGLVSMRPTPQQAQAAFIALHGADLMVTNLGQLSFPRYFGELELQAIYGPTVTLGNDPERVVGVSTVNEQIFFTFTYQDAEFSPAQAQSLQELAMNMLTQHCLYITDLLPANVASPQPC